MAKVENGYSIIVNEDVSIGHVPSAPGERHSSDHHRTAIFW